MSDEAPLADLLMGAARTLRRRVGGVLEPWGLSPHHARALRSVGRAQGRAGGLRLSDVAAALRIAPRSATEVIDALAERGLVQRGPDPDDRRAVVVSLTDAGRSVLDEVEAARAADAERLFARLDDAERAELARLLGRLVEEEAPARGGED